MRRLLLALGGLAAIAAVAGAGVAMLWPDWSGDELKTIQSLSLASLPPLKPDPSNRVSDDPAAAALGKALFFDTRLSANGEISCASCHKPDRQFQDDLPVGQGMAEGNRRTMPIAGTAYFPFLFWDGRKDSAWSQALGPLEDPAEHGGNRVRLARLVLTHHSVPNGSTKPPILLPSSWAVISMAGRAPPATARAYAASASGTVVHS